MQSDKPKETFPPAGPTTPSKGDLLLAKMMRVKTPMVSEPAIPTPEEQAQQQAMADEMAKAYAAHRPSNDKE